MAGLIASAVVAVGVGAGVGCGATSGGSAAGGASEADLDAGRVLYEQSCSACHGMEGQGTDQGPPFVDEIYEPSHHADAAFLIAVRRGVPAHHWDFGDMPSQPGVSDQDVGKIVAYVRLLQRDAGIE